MSFSKQHKVFISICLLTIFSALIALPTKIGNFQIPRLNLKLGKLDFSQEIPLKQGLDIRGGVQVTLATDMSQTPADQRTQAIESLKEVVGRRIDLFGVSEVSLKTLQAGNDYRLILELPGVTDSQQALSLIGQTAQMQFAFPVYVDGKTASEPATLVDFRPSNLSGSDLKKAEVTFQTDDRLPAVSLEFKEEGRKKFAQITKENLNKPLAVLLDGYPITMPTIQSEIVDGNAIISGNFTIDEAKALAVQLNAGALPVPVSILSQKNIPATLGAESIQKSLLAGGIGLSMVIIFMVLYYGKLGFIASLGLTLYGLYTLVLYKLLGVVLSLPGIAGFLLSVGMAVDSNILVFERYKEEIRAGRPWPVALELAFGRAWDSIKDANTATIITGLILINPLNWPFLNTSGSVKGFALTLILGILTSLFTGLVVTRNLLRLFFKGKSQQSMSAIGRSAFGGNWMKHLPIYFLISALVIIPGVYSLVRYGFKLSIEFTGGTRVTVEPNTAKQFLLETLKDYSPQLEQETGKDVTFKLKELSEEKLNSLIAENNKDKTAITIKSFEVVGPVLGQETLRKTLNALLLSSLLLLAYISFAFKQFKYGFSAVLAMLHDTLVLLGSFSLLGHFYGVEVDLLFVTAVLTILSFSVHDTIVVYDRIRELSHKIKNVSYISLVNQAVTETMVRSLNNSLTIIFMLIAMFLIGGETTRFFSLALLIGTITGTYSSTFTAAPLLVLWDILSK